MKKSGVMKFHYLLISISLLVQFWTVTGSALSISNLPTKCTTPSGAEGHCTYLSDCSNLDILANIGKVIEYSCTFERETIFHSPLLPTKLKTTRVGVCCQDDIKEQPSPEVESVTVPSKSATDELEKTGGQIPSKLGQHDCRLLPKDFVGVHGGRPAKPGQWPWMAAIILPGGPEARCGGTLITHQHVLTAAHCLRQYEAEDIYIRLGEYDFDVSNETEAQDFRALWVRMHKEYNRTTKGNDIAVVKMDRSIPVNSTIVPVCRPPVGVNWEGWTGILTGWGRTGFTKPMSNVLMKASVLVWTHKRCEEVYDNYRTDDSVLCAGLGGKADACQGDSGSPLLVQLSDKRWVVVAFVSRGEACEEGDNPGVYTRVDKYLEWIGNNLS